MRGGVPRTASLAGVAGVAPAALAGSAAPTGRIYGYENIKRHLQRQKRAYGSGGGSLAGYAHEHKREIARRLRQQARIAERQAERLEARGGGQPITIKAGSVIGLTRRGRFVVA